MHVHRRGWFLTAISLATASVLMAAPAVWADDDKKGSDDHDKHADPPVVKVENENENAEHAAPAVVNVQQDNEAAEHAAPAVLKVENEAPEVENEAAEHAVPAAVMSTRAANLVAAFNSQATELAALTATVAPADVEEDNDDVEANAAVEEVQLVNLSSLTAGLTGTDLTSVTNAANADASAVATFFNANSAAATAIKARLAAAGINAANVLAIISGREDHVTVVLNA